MKKATRERERPVKANAKPFNSEMAIEDLVPYARNARVHSPAQVEQIAEAISRFGFINPVVVWKNGEIVAGHGRVLAAQKLLDTGKEEYAYLAKLPVRRVDHLTDIERRAYAIADNKLALNSSWDDAMLKREIEALMEEDFDMTAIGFDEDEIKIDEDEVGEDGKGGGSPGTGQLKLADKFMIPPFSVFNTREGWWQSRKRQWIDLGLQSEVGRGENEAPKKKGDKNKPGLTYVKGKRDPEELDEVSKMMLERGNGTSVFDPVLCEIAYRWFSKEGAQVLDPFAGGSVRGVVAGHLGRNYFGVDIRPEQIEANREQVKTLCKDTLKPVYATGDSAKIATLAKGVKADLLFSCPPYVDLEVYSDLPDDLSNMSHTDFIGKYFQIIAESVKMLKDNRFAVWVVGEARDKKGNYYNLVGDTIAAFLAAGMSYYNEAILVNAAGSLPVRVSKQFCAARKLGKCHQNVLVFVKGDPKKAAQACGEVTVGNDLFPAEANEE